MTCSSSRVHGCRRGSGTRVIISEQVPICPQHAWTDLVDFIPFVTIVALDMKRMRRNIDIVGFRRTVGAASEIPGFLSQRPRPRGKADFRQRARLSPITLKLDSCARSKASARWLTGMLSRASSPFRLLGFRCTGLHLGFVFDGDPDLREVDWLEGRQRRTTWKNDSRGRRGH